MFQNQLIAHGTYQGIPHILASYLLPFEEQLLLAHYHVSQLAIKSGQN